MEAKYKVGDKVTIKRTRNGSSGDYRFSFTDEMVSTHGGKRYTIESVCKADSLSDSHISDDGYRYSLEEVGFTWASSMFEDEDDEQTLIVDALSSSHSSESDNDISAFIRTKKRPKLDFNL